MPGADRLVIDASAAVKACMVEDGFGSLETSRSLVAPTLIWSEFASAVSQLRWRQELTDLEASATVRRFLEGPIEGYPSRDLLEHAVSVARRLGWAKTYDAEYVALAQRLDAPLLTIDTRLRTQASALITVVGPLDIPD